TQKGKGTIKATGVFTLMIPPIIEKFSPAGGFPGTVVTISGKHFGVNSINLRVKLGNQIIKILSFTDTRIESQIPKDGQGGKLTVEVTGKGGDTSDADFDVWVPVKFYAFSPTKGEVGTTVVIKGQGFGTDLKNVEVTLAGNPQKILALTSSQIQVQVPGKSVSGFLQVTVKDRGAPVSSTAEFKVIYPPEVTKFKPAAGQPGTLLTVDGKNFGMLIDSIRVLVGPGKKQQFCIVSKLTDSKLTCQIQPNTLSGPVKVKVKGMGEAITQKTFDVWKPVTVTSFTPKDGLPGTLVTINGGGFVTKKGATSVKVGGKAIKVKSITNNMIVIQIPDKGVAGGSFEVNVKGRGTAVSPGTFKVILPTKISTVKPTSGPVGTVVTIKGQGFGDNVNQIAVTFMGFYCTVTSVSPSEIEVIVPDGLTEGISGKFQIIVTTGGIAEAPKAFKITKPKKPKKPKNPKVKAKPIK
ncbi:MAG: IPT/TIG domain-containing protein, partial [Deltaproteobacteria bacterium]|nr:IPT/TIG domain-containing protein [Deltaproteobacteria bacterium]